MIDVERKVVNEYNMEIVAETMNHNFGVVVNKLDTQFANDKKTKRIIGKRTFLGLIFAGYCVYKIREQRNDIRELRHEVKELKSDQDTMQEELDLCKNEMHTDDGK